MFSLIIFIAGLTFILASDQEKPDPYKEYENITLFKIERSRDADEVWYTLNFDNNHLLNQNAPVKAFWVRKTERNSVAPLTPIQRRYGYGIKFVHKDEVSAGIWYFQLAAYKDRVFKLENTGRNRYKVFIQSENREIEVLKIYVSFNGGTFLIPSVEKVELRGIDRQTGNLYTENITP